MAALLGLDQTNEEVYPPLDWRLTVQVGGYLWLIGAAAAFVVVPFAAPTHVLGDAGWVVVGAITVGAATSGIYLILRPEAVPPLAVLLMGYIAAVGLGVGQTLIGPQANFDLPFVLIAAYHASVHPARRVLPLLVWIAVCEAVSVSVTSPEAVDIAQLVTGVMLLTLLTLMALIHARSNRSLASRLTRRQADAEFRALTDPLTGLGNRRAFDEALERELAGSRRYVKPLSLGMLDVDDFKSINDRFGHDAGDEALIAIGIAITNEIRRPDMCFRWGGDEFAVLLPAVVLEDAEVIGARIIEAVCHDTRLPDNTPILISCGAATLGPGERAEDLIERADKGLFAAKRQPSALRPTLA